MRQFHILKGVRFFLWKLLKLSELHIMSASKTRLKYAWTVYNDQLSYRLWWLNPFRNKLWFLRVWSASLLKTLWEKEKLLVTSNFSFSHSVFYMFVKHSAIFINFWNCRLLTLSVWESLKFVVWERVNTSNDLVVKCGFAKDEKMIYFHFFASSFPVYCYYYIPAKRMFSGVYWNQPVCLSVSVSICLQNASFCQSAGGGITSHLVRALISFWIALFHFQLHIL